MKKSSFRPLRRSRTLRRRTMRGGDWQRQPAFIGGRKRRSMRGGGRWAPRGDITFQEGGRKRRPMRGGVQPYDHPPAID